MRRLWPDSLLGRTAVVLLAGLLISNLIGLVVYSGERRASLAGVQAARLGERVAALAQLVNETPPGARPVLALRLQGPGLRWSWTPAPAIGADDRDAWAERVTAAIRSELGGIAPDRLRTAYGDPALIAPPPENSHQRMMREHGRRSEGRDSRFFGPGGVMDRPWLHDDRWGGRVLRLSLRLDDGSWLNLAAPAGRVTPFWATGFFPAALLATLGVLAVSLWAASRATQPLKRFAEAAERLGRDVTAPALEEDGPREVRRAAAAFNGMQKRLRRFVEDRTQMLAAISHDLKTPITRLRLRAEFVEDEEARRKMLTDLDDMERMIAATLAFARDEAAQETRVRLDLADLLQSLVEGAQDAGGEAGYAGPEHLAVTGAPGALKRAFGNLIDNALNYGGNARVTLAEEAGGAIMVTVGDDGPGLPEAELEKVFQPFYRVERSRSRETGGVGLGLAVVRSILRGHGGDVRLENRAGGGLDAVATLPGS